MFVYLDNSATTKPYDEVVEAVTIALKDNFGNPSSMYSIGLDGEKLVKDSREALAQLIGRDKNEIYFTSGGTESDNMAVICSAIKNNRIGKKIITTKVEHPAVLESMKSLEKHGYEVIYIDVDKNCNINIEQYKNEMTSDVALVSIMTANNEIGTIYPIEELYKLKSDNAIFHTDSVQALGKIKLFNADIISFSSHKIHGPKGIGAIYIKKGINLPPYIVGGGQEKKMRSGTENVPGIAGFGVACRLSKEFLDSKGMEKVRNLKNYLIENVKNEIDDIKVNTPENSLPTVANISFLGTRSEVILHRLEEDNIYVSAGSACSSNKNNRSHVLKAMGLSDIEIDGTLRFSLSQFTTKEEIDYAVDKLKKAVKSFRTLVKRR